MKLSIFSTLALAALTSAVPQGTPAGEVTKADCVKPYLCCDKLKTPLDSTVQPILRTLGVNAESIVGSVGLMCKAYGSSCTSQPQCCSQANLLGGTVALGCQDLKSPKPA